MIKHAWRYGGSAGLAVALLTACQLQLRPFAVRGAVAAPAPSATVAVLPTQAPKVSLPLLSATVTPTPRQVSPSFATAHVRSIANVRDQPTAEGSRVLGQLRPGELISLLFRTPDGKWYGMDNHSGLVGWTTAELLDVEPVIVASVPFGQAGDLAAGATAVPAGALPPAAGPLPNWATGGAPAGQAPTAPRARSRPSRPAKAPRAHH